MATEGVNYRRAPGSHQTDDTMSIVRASKALLVWMLLIAAVMAPITDVAAFGIHDHITVPNANGDELRRDGSDPARSHHCELGMSPGALLVAAAPAPFHVVATLNAPQAPPRRSQTLSVPASPPRS